MKATLILKTEYLRSKMSKTNRTEKTENKLNELIDHFDQLHYREYFNEMDIERKYRVPTAIQPPKHRNAEHTEAKW